MFRGSEILSKPDRRTWVVAVALCAAAFAAFANSLNVPFLLDDQSAILENPALHHTGGLRDLLLPTGQVTTAGRPLLNLSLALNHAWGGEHVRGYHAFNLAVHVGAALTLFGLLRRTFLTARLHDRFAAMAVPLAAAIAAVWMLHPIQTSAVTYISQRAESLMGLFYLLTLYGFVRATSAERPHVWSVVSVLSCCAGMATKEVMATAPVLVLLYDRTFCSSSVREALTRRKHYYAALAGSWLLLGVLLVTSNLGARNVGFDRGVFWWQYLLAECRVVFDYARLVLWPHPLVFDYGVESFFTDPARSLPFVFALLGSLAIAITAWKKSWLPGILAGWFLLLLAPTSSFVPIAGQPMAESRLYLPSAALVALIISGTVAVLGRRAITAFLLLAVLLGGLTRTRNHDYRSALALWEDTVAKRPGSSRAHSNLGKALADAGRDSEAIAHAEAAVRLRPEDSDAHNLLGSLLAKQPNRLADALAHYQIALTHRPWFAEAHNNLGVALASLPNRAEDAIAEYRAALALRPWMANVHFNLANTLATLPGRATEAIQHYREALRLKPSFPEAHNGLANQLANDPAQLAAAIAHYEQAIRLKPDFGEAHNNLAIRLAAIPERRADALAHYEAALRISPNFFAIHYNLANLLAATPGNAEAAIARYRTALDLNPASLEARTNLVALLLKLGDKSTALRELRELVRFHPEDKAAAKLLNTLSSATP